MDETEITNLSWREYMYWTKTAYGESSPEFIATLPDTSVWLECYNDVLTRTKLYITDLKSMITVYLRHPQFSHYPVVGITFEQAKQFCAWRTDRVNEVYYVSENKNVTFPLDSSLEIPKKVKFRLPTEEEWENVAKAGFDTSRFVNNIEKYYYNTTETAAIRSVKQSYERYIPMMDLSLKPDNFNRYHIFGNVAEMTNTPGVSKGGSFINSLEECYFTNRIYYSKPEYWLGFRCICEVL